MIVACLVLGWFLLTLAAAGVVYTAMTSVFVARFFKAAPEIAIGAGSGEAVTLLKPLHGQEPGLIENLESFFTLRRQSAIDVVFGLQDPADPALAIAETVKARHPLINTTICLSAAAHGQNRKISNLINMSSAATASEVLVLTDSDIGVEPDYLERVLAALAAPEVGVVTCPYYGAARAGFWSRIAAMGLSYQFLPNVITGVSLGMAKPCMGSTIALRRGTLERIGGFEAFRDALADDYEIGAAVRRLGLKSVVAPILVSHGCGEGTLGEVFAHELRWAKTVKGVDPTGHGGSVVTHPLPLALLAAVFLNLSLLSIAVLAAAFVARVWLMGATDRVIGRRLGPWWLLPLRDMLSFAVFVGSFFGRSVEWRGVKFQVSADGDLKPV